MLIKLLPTHPSHPTVLFGITFESCLPEGVQVPISWTSQQALLLADSLELPKYIHALDAASIFPCLLEEVVFDIQLLLISCRFIDGSCVEWSLMDSKCLTSLENVLRDVTESTREVEEPEREGTKEKEKREELPELLNSPPSTIKGTRHKKQRSLLMSLVA
jgi:hypothetical protein